MPKAHRVAGTEDGQGFGAYDYATAFAVTDPADGAMSPEQWARATFEGAPRVVRGFVRFGWRAVLRFRLGPRPSTSHVLGWTVRCRASDSVILEVSSASVAARKVVRVEKS